MAAMIQWSSAFIVTSLPLIFTVLALLSVASSNEMLIGNIFKFQFEISFLIIPLSLASAEPGMLLVGQIIIL